MLLRFGAHLERHRTLGQCEQLLPGFNGIIRFFPLFEIERAPIIG
jgi:hypothetical protein